MLIGVGYFAVVVSVDLIDVNVFNVKIKWRLKETNSLLTTCILKNAELGVTHQAELAACNKDLTTVAGWLQGWMDSNYHDTYFLCKDVSWEFESI